jgi:DNA repair exonuclease SbcCD nuclease subunit
MVVLHGAIKGAIYGMDKVDFNGKTPVFGLESFRRCYGPIICGHVHVAKCFENHIYYCGSPIRWKFGEEQAKGFLICTYNPNTYQYYMHFQVIESFRYDTINLTNMLAFEPIVVIEHIKKLKEKGIDYIKIKFDTACPTTDLIKKHFSTSRDIKIDVADAKFAETIQRNQENVDDMDKYAYMLNPNAKPEEIFVQYVNQCMGECYITVEELTKILNEGI